MKKIIKMKRFASGDGAIGTRRQGREIFALVGDGVDFDFSGVSFVTSAFADELFGNLIRERGAKWLKENTHIVNAEDAVRLAIGRTIAPLLK